jgi:hypothetical protein
VTLTIDVKGIVRVLAIEVHIVSENFVVSTEMVVSYAVDVSSNVVVVIIEVCPTVGNCAMAVLSSEFKVLFSTEEVKSLTALTSLSVVLTSSVVVVVSVSSTILAGEIFWVEAIVVYIVSENATVSTETLVSNSVMVLSNIAVEILRACPTVMNWARVEL